MQKIFTLGLKLELITKIERLQTSDFGSRWWPSAGFVICLGAGEGKSVYGRCVR